MKHENGINALLKELFYESWMNDEDYKEVVDLTLKGAGITKQKLSNDIEIGIKNGLTIEDQFHIISHILTP